MRGLDGLRVLIVEDNFVVADSLRTLILAYGGQVTAMVPSVDDALPVLETAAFDVAVLDIHLKGDKVHRLADSLMRDQIPFVFVTGYGDGSILPEHLRAAPRLDKPVDPELLLATLATVVASRAPTG